jgi:hypothetical protein
LRQANSLLQERSGTFAGYGLAIRSDRVLKVDDNRVGAAGKRLLKLSVAVGGGEEE